MLIGAKCPCSVHLHDHVHEQYNLLYSLTCTCTVRVLQVCQMGEYVPEKVSVKCGSLDFVISAPSPCIWWELPLLISKKTEDITISLLPSLGSQSHPPPPPPPPPTCVCMMLVLFCVFLLFVSFVVFLAGYPQECTLTFETGSDITVPNGSTVSLMMSSDVTISCQTGM